MFPALAPPFWAVMIMLNITIWPALPTSVGNPAVIYNAPIEENAAPDRKICSEGDNFVI
jgi:hypothetical protein